MSWANENSEFFDDSMICDDWVDYDLDVTKEENNLLNTSELSADEIPPKTACETDTPYAEGPTFQSPKIKKRKLASFDDLLENLNFNILYMNFTKLLQFLQSNTKEICFPFTLKEYEDFFKIIVQDISVLKSRSLDANYRDICNSIIDAASFERTGYLLTYAYEHRKGYENKVLVIKKVYSMSEPVEEESSLSSSSESIMPSSQSSSQADPNETLRRSNSPAMISSEFIIHCLRTILAFVKNDVTKIKEFPELSTDQAQFMHLLLESIITFVGFENNLEIKQLYKALWEAVKIYSLKYEFRIKPVETWGGKKSLVFEKIPKEKPVETAVNSNQCAVNSNQTGINSSQIAVNSNQTAVNLNQTAINSNQIMNPKTEVPKPEVPNPQLPKPELPNPIETSKVLTKKMLKKQLNLENNVLFVKMLPSTFVLDALNSIVEFLSDDCTDKMVLLPKNQHELLFYRKCIEWCRSSVTEALFGTEYERLHDKIAELLTRMKCKVPKASSNKINVNTGVKEVTYIKKPKIEPVVDGSAQRRINKRKHSINSDLSMDRSNSIGKSVSKKKKMNLQSILNSPGIAENTTVININQSLRMKKKNKKLKNLSKSKDSVTSIGLSTKAARQVTRWSEDSDSDDSGDSVDRRNKEAKAKRALNKASQSTKASLAYRERLRGRRGTQQQRKEQLIEALSVPVQSDKAMKMMRGMGWCGGALGARGNGITVPIMPTLDLPTGAGLGAGRILQPETIPKKLKNAKTGPFWISKNLDAQKQTLEPEGDVIVEKTKQLLLGNPSFNTLIKAIELPKPTNPNIELSKPTKQNVEFPKPTNSNVEFPEPTNSIMKLTDPGNFRLAILQCFLELLKTDATSKTLKCNSKICIKNRKYVTNVMRALKANGNNSIFIREEYEIANKIRAIYRELPQFVVKAFIGNNCMDVDIRKFPNDFKPPVLQHEESIISPKPIHAIITEKNIKSYIEASGTPYESQKAFETLKFRVLFLLNVLNFVKSLNEELEVTFNKVVPQKQQSYIEKSVDEINKRIKFGNTPAEIKLSIEIKNHIKDAFLGAMFNHQYTSVTLNKYFRFKRLNRPDNAVKRKSQTSVNLDNFTSESLNETKLCTGEITAKENNNAADDNNSADNESDITGRGTCNNNNTATDKVANLLPGEEGVNLSHCLCLYDKEKRNKPSGNENNVTNNNKVSTCKNNTNETDNRNSKNNIGNGNVDIDNNDNQVIDMKKVDDKITKNVTEMVAEYVMCVDYTEEVINSEDLSIGNFNNEAVHFSENESDEINEQPIKHSEIFVANNDDLETMNQYEDNVDNKLQNHEIDAMMNEVLLNTEDPLDQDVMVNEDSVDNDNCTEINIVKDEIKNILENPSKNVKDIKKEETDVTMKEISIKEPMEIISIKEESLEVMSLKEESIKVDKDESKEIDVEIARRNDENSIKPINDVIVKADTNLELKTDCDIISKENIGLSEDNCDNQSVGDSHSEMISIEKDVPNILNKKESQIKIVYIVHFNNPITKLTKENAKEIQKIISTNIVQTKELPLLMCHGVVKDALIYTCHNKKSFDWLENTISSIGDIRVLSTRDITKMALKFNCFFDFDTVYLFRMIELYNQALSTKEWVVEKTEINDGYAIFVVRMDKFSINYIHASGLALFAGVDKVEFSLIWE